MSDPKPEAIDAMDAIFQFAKAMETGLTVNDLTVVCDLAIDEGHETIEIMLTMMTAALQRSAENRKAAPA